MMTETVFQPAASAFALSDGARTATGELSAAARDVLVQLYDHPRCSCDALTSTCASDPTDFFAVVSGLLADRLIEVVPRSEADAATRGLITDAARSAAESLKRQERDSAARRWYQFFKQIETDVELPAYMLAITREGRRQLERAVDSRF
ncbi:MAG: hypothetical protein U0704_03595 [Candidatus Eisenbacteria bacterium]